MKKKAKPTAWEALTPFTLYLDDIRDLHDIVAEVSTSVQYETDAYSDLAGPDELATLGSQGIKDLTITGTKGSRPQLVIRVLRSGASVWAADDSAPLIGAMEKARHVMWRHVNGLAVAELWWLYAGLFLLAIPYVLSQAKLPPLGWPTVVLVLTAIAIAVYGRDRAHTKYTTIVLVPKYEASNLWQRHGATIVISLVLGLLVAAIWAYVTKTPPFSVVPPPA